jgi:RNA polymerase sigma-70 factor (ECF subfamily)
MTIGLAFDQVLTAARAGAGWARARLYESLAPAVAGYVRAQGIDDPSDVTSEVFLAVLTALPSFDGDERQFRSWVFTIAYRRAMDHWRARAKSPDLPAPATAPAAEDVALAGLGRERVRALLDELTPDQRQVLALRVIGDLSLEQVADALGKPVGAVKSLQHRALQALRRRIAGEAVSR